MNDKLYVAGGISAYPSTQSSNIMVYDMIANEWTMELIQSESLLTQVGAAMGSSSLMNIGRRLWWNFVGKASVILDFDWASP